MRRYTIKDENNNIELTNISLMGLVYEAENLSEDELDAIAYLGIGSSVTFDPKRCNTKMTSAVKFTRTE
jgi:hypothetical protein